MKGADANGYCGLGDALHSFKTEPPAKNQRRQFRYLDWYRLDRGQLKQWRSPKRSASVPKDENLRSYAGVTACPVASPLRDNNRLNRAEFPGSP
jgi:hypothetical protein